MSTLPTCYESLTDFNNITILLVFMHYQTVSYGPKNNIDDDSINLISTK